MSRSVDKRIVEMDLNNKNFENNAKTSISTIQKLKEALKFDNAEDGFYRVEKAASTVNLNPIINSVDELTKKFDAFGIFGIEVMRKISNAAIQTGEKIWNATIGQIKSGGSARALNIANAQFKLEGMGVAWKEASKDISAAVDGTAYGFDAAANTAAQLATAGIELGESYGGMAHALKAVSGIAAMTNASYEEIGYIFSQIASAGRLLGQDAMQISTRGINVTATLAKQLGKTTEEIQEMQKKGEISFALFAESMYDAFGEQASKANNTFQGALSNVKAALSRIGEIWYGPFYNAAITPLNKIRVAINQIKKAFDDGNESTEDFKTRLTELMSIVSNIFSWLTENVDLRFFTNIANGANMVLDAMNDIGHAIERTLGIFKTDKAVEENEKLADSLRDLTEAELQAAKDIWETGKYGNGQDRINNLLAAGFTEEGARRVQLAINKFIDSNYQWAEVEKEVGKQAEENDKKMEGLSQTITSKFVRSFIAARNAASVLGDAIGNVASGVWNIVKMVGSSFVENFNFEIIFKDIESIAYRIRFFTEEFRKFTTGNTKFRKFIDEIFKVANDIYRVIRAAASILNTVISSLYKVIKETISGLDMGEVSISKFTDKIASWAENLAIIIKRSEIFVVIFRKIVDVIKNLINYAKQLPSVLQPFFDKTKKNLDILLNKFKQLTGIDVVSGIKKAWDKIKELFSMLSDPSKLFNASKSSFTKWAEGVKEAILSTFKSPKELFEKIKNWFKETFEKIKADPKAIVPTKLFTILGHLFSDIIVSTGNVDLNQVAKIVRNVGAIILLISGVLLALAEKKLVDTLTKPVATVKQAMEKVIEMTLYFKDLGNRITRAVEIDLLANSFIKVAVGVAILAASIAGLGMLDTQTLVKGLTAVTICVIALAGAIVAYNKSVDPKAIKMLDSTMIQFGLSMGIIGLLAIKFGKMDYESLGKAVVMMGILTSVFTQMALINQINVKGSDNGFAKNILSLAVAIDLLIPFAKIVGEMHAWSIMKALGAFIIIFKELEAVAVELAFVSDFVNASEVAGFAAAMLVLSIAVDATIPFLELVGNMRPTDALQGILGFGVMLVALAGVLVAATKIMNGLDSTDTVLIAASISIVALSMNALIPSLLTMAKMEQMVEGSVFEAISSLATILIAIAGVLTLMSMFTIGTDVLMIATSLVGTVIALSLMIPGLVALAAVPKDKLIDVVEVLGLLGAIFTGLVAILAITNAATAESVVAIMALIAIGLAEIAFSIIATTVAIGVAATMIGTAAVKIVASIDSFNRMDTSNLKSNAKAVVKALDAIVDGINDLAPKVATAVLSFIGALMGGFKALAPNFREFVYEWISNGVALIVQFIPSIIMGIIKGIVMSITKALEWLVDGSGGVTYLARIAGAITAAIIIIMNEMSANADEIVSTFVNLIIAYVKAVTNAINERGEEWVNAWSELGDAIAWYIGIVASKISEKTKEAVKGIITAIGEAVGEKKEELKTKLEQHFDQVVLALKNYYDIKDGDDPSTRWYKVGNTIVENIVNGLIHAFGTAAGLRVELTKAISEFCGLMVGDFVEGIGDNKKKMTEETSDMLSESEKEIFSDAFGMESPAKDWWEAAKNCLAGLVNGFKDNIGLSELSISGMLGDLQSAVFGELGGDGEGTFMDNLMGMLGIDDENTFSLSPVLDTSQFDKDYSSFADQIGLDTNYNFGSTTSGLGSDISFQTQGGISQSGFTSENVEGLRTDVQDIAERIGRLEVRMDTGALVGALYAGIDEKLGEKQILAGRGVYA